MSRRSPRPSTRPSDSNRLRHYRMTYLMTQDQLAEKIHVSKSHVSKLELGLWLPSADVAKRISDFFGVKVEAMFPEGTREQYGIRKFMHYPVYEPPSALAPQRTYPSGSLPVLCYHCRRIVTLRADDRHSLAGGEAHDPSCPSCGARFYEIVPLEEMTI